MSYRGLWITLGFVATGLTGFVMLPNAYPFWAALCFLGTLAGGAIWARDYYRALKNYVLTRDEFNRKLRREAHPNLPPLSDSNTSVNAN